MTDMTTLKEITTLLDSTLRIAEVKDAPMALNGLQVENNGQVTKVALAVDGSQKTIDDAIAAGADLLVLHHGIYWCGLRPMTGWFRKKIVSCLEHNLASHNSASRSLMEICRFVISSSIFKVSSVDPALFSIRLRRK